MNRQSCIKDFLLAFLILLQNHAVRKADFGRRFLETVYPVFNKKGSGVWSWIIDKLGLTKEDASKKDDASNIQDFDADSVVFPWHLLKISEDDLLIADRRYVPLFISSILSFRNIKLI